MCCCESSASRKSYLKLLVMVGQKFVMVGQETVIFGQMPTHGYVPEQNLHLIHMHNTTM